MSFRYRAYTANGRMVSDEISAADEAEAIRNLMRDGLTPFEILPAKGGRKAKTEAGSKGKRLPAKTLAGFARNLATMSAGGLPIDEALQLISNDPSDKLVSSFAEGVRDSVMSGKTLADALAEQPRVPPDYVIGLVRAGEAGGSLAPVLERISTSIENQIRLGNSLRSALIYPAILFATAFASVILILLVVAPALKPVLQANGENTPASAKALIAASEFLQEFWLAGALGLLLFVLLIMMWSRSSAGRRLLSALSLRIPVIGRVLLEVETARFLSSLSALLENGLTMVPALGIAKEGSGNPLVQEAAGEIAEDVRQGSSLSNAITEDGFFPTAAAHMAAVGEKAGSLPRMLAQSAQIFEDRSARQISRITTIAGPLLTLVLGLVIGGVVLTLLGAIMSVNDLAVQ
ncbi:MAG: type II secretion system F family protein [Henriciella sp.]